jgi:hypothetical protein
LANEEPNEAKIRVAVALNFLESVDIAKIEYQAVLARRLLRDDEDGGDDAHLLPGAFLDHLLIERLLDPFLDDCSFPWIEGWIVEDLWRRFATVEE